MMTKINNQNRMKKLKRKNKGERSMASPSYDFYTTTYGGNCVTQETFAGLAVRANSVLMGVEGQAEVTYFDVDIGRNLTLCALVDEVYSTIQAQQPQTVGGASMQGAISSVSTGATSVSFVAQAPQEIVANAQQRYHKAIRQFAHIYQGGRWNV